MAPILCRYGEIALKGKNRSIFESKLMSNIKYQLKDAGIDSKVSIKRGRIFVDVDDHATAVDRLSKVFGLVSISPAFVCDPDIDRITETAVRLAKESDSATFRVSSRRSNKKFHMSSSEIDMSVGSAIVEATGKKVKLKGADLDVGIEVHESVYIFTESVKAPGGIPVGMSGKVVCLVDKQNDLLAAWLMMKRGCEVTLAIVNDIDLSKIKLYYPKELKTVEIDTLDGLVRSALDSDVRAVVLGYTLEDLEKNGSPDLDILVLYPMIAYGDEEINDIMGML